jgi:hypothetical protein
MWPFYGSPKLSGVRYFCRQSLAFILFHASGLNRRRKYNLRRGQSARSGQGDMTEQKQSSRNGSGDG